MTTALLLHCDGTSGSTSFPDTAGTPAKTVTAYGNAQVTTSNPKWGTGSALFDGSGDYLLSAADSGLAPGSSWTIECWVRPASAAAVGGIFYLGNIGSDNNRIMLQVMTDLSLRLFVNSGGSYWYGPTVANVLALNTWKHVALVKNGTWLSLYSHGSRKQDFDSGFVSTPTNNTVTVGRTREESGGTINYFNGQIDDFRFTPDVALYSGSTLTVPSAAFADGAVDHHLEGAAAATATASAYFAGQAPLDGDAAARATASGALSHGIPLAGSGGATATATGNLSEGFAIPTSLTVSYATGSIEVPTSLAVSEAGSISAPTALAVITTATASGENWTARCLIDGVDVSATLTGVASVTADEGAARIAQLSIKPPAGTIAPLDYVGKSIALDYVLVIGGTPVPRRIFTGLIDTPDYNLTTGLLTLSCVDDLQNRVAALDRSVIDELIGGRYTEAVQGDIDDNWDYAKALLSTVAGSLDAGASGGMRLTPWVISSTWATYDADDLLFEKSNLTLPQRSTLVNHVDIEFAYRYPRLRQRYTTVGWSGTQGDMVRNGYNYPKMADILGAAGGSGWTVTLSAWWHAPAAIPHSSGGFIYPVEGSIDMAVLWLTQRHSQTVTESYTITVTAPESVTANGELAHAMRGALAEPFDGEAWESALDIAPLLSTGGEQDYAPTATRADSDYAIQTLLDQANVKILGTHRGARVSNAVPCNPDLDLDKRIAIATAEMNVAGKVSGITHRLDFMAGSAITEFSLACFGAGGAGIITPDTFDPPTPPDEAVATQDWGSDVTALTCNTYGGTPYSDNLMGLLLNPPETITVEDVPDIGTKSYPNPFYYAGSYPVTGFRCRMPGVDDADRNPLTKVVTQAYQTVIVPDTLEFKVL